MNEVIYSRAYDNYLLGLGDREHGLHDKRMAHLAGLDAVAAQVANPEDRTIEPGVYRWRSYGYELYDRGDGYLGVRRIGQARKHSPQPH